MKIPEVICREYDIRGIVGEQVDAPLAAAIGRAFTTLLRSQGYPDPRIAVGRDNRPSGELLASAVRDGISAAGGTAIDVGELYDAFSFTPMMALEDLGFCGKGESGPFIERGRTEPGGDFPLNTNGGGLSYGHSGMYGMFPMIEMVRQLRGETGDRHERG